RKRSTSVAAAEIFGRPVVPAAATTRLLRHPSPDAVASHVPAGRDLADLASLLHEITIAAAGGAMNTPRNPPTIPPIRVTASTASGCMSSAAPNATGRSSPSRR